jgi:beta-glucosidase
MRSAPASHCLGSAGLSYTTFKFENLRVEPQQIYSGGTAKVSVDITNTGDPKATKYPQMYIHQRIASVPGQ